MPAVFPIAQLSETIITHGNVWRYNGTCMNSRLVALEDPKLIELSRLGGVRRIDLMYSACRRLLSLKLCHESRDRICCAFNHDLDAGIAKVSNESDKPVGGCDSVDEGSEPYPLNDTLDEKSSPRYTSHPIHAGVSRFGNRHLMSNVVRTGRPPR
jgi:hypothetical protein